MYGLLLSKREYFFQASEGRSVRLIRDRALKRIMVSGDYKKNVLHNQTDSNETRLTEIVELRDR